MLTNTLPSPTNCISQLIQCLKIRAQSTGGFKKIRPPVSEWPSLLRENACRCSEQGTVAFLTKMAVIGQNVGDAALTHNIHRNAIRQAVAFIEPLFVERHARQKRVLCL